ncbi:chromosome segregation protein SMC [Pseudomonas sp. P9_35]|uniref:chromosome segregation protein SMC n=1 Tax=unclassified Pseudomonas TaxID=196821 RepID=UPI002A36B0D7|nr:MULTISPECIES: chromosome segregation protein SMC [unclassified Pseudomonas]WPN62670.1 chromosome segregation protein SMC [Pseudomonas sp. P9_32]WPN68425.1 chromosome segregation protein SMC [Pseudomonas sp. P9_35]
MTDFQANTEQCELLTDERESREVTDLARPISDGTEATGHCKKKQLLLDEIEKLKISRDKYLSEAEQLYTEMAPLEALLEGDEVMDAHRQYEVRKQYNDLKRPYDSRKHHASIITSQITRRENLANHETLMAGYTEAMANWKADEQELNEKRNSLSSRLEQIRRQANEDMASAREAETDAATAYAQAVAWGDTEGEKNASADAQKAAKNLATATEHNRRQHLIMSALEQELVTVDKYIVEAQKEHKAIERHALLLAHTVLEEQWNAKAEELLDMGGKLWASYRLIDRDQVSLRKLVLPFEGERFGHWNSNDLVERSYKHTVQDVLSS